ncbi:hypothetical protein JAGODDHD_04025 (plasmid) [Sphingomonas paucimobilis]|uniref:SGNH/GDSL hydrolase family protein n=1 Tax=Sphingomonas paucimobilis TaxID=13689 RepID=UPI002435291E|nr:SGNH/GDSL hydrolase family protein [Sphingomonas paucimobilis]MDG5973255.1 hypothetical protein [Sphingomonas paucimobilis]
MTDTPFPSRRRFLTGTACTIALPLIPGCADDKAPSDLIIPTPTPTPQPSPTPTPTPTPTPAPTRPTTLAADRLTIAFAGSSSSAQYLSNYDGPATSSAVVSTGDGISFAPLGRGAFGKTAGLAINAATGRTVRYVRGGVGSTTLIQWAATNSTMRADLVRAIVAAGGVDAVLLQVGRNDVADRLTGDLATQLGLIRTLIAALRSETRLPDLTVFIGGSQNIGGSDAGLHRMQAIQRQAEMTVALGDPHVRYGFTTYDLPVVDGIHQSEQGQIRSGQRFAAQVLAWLQGQPGPRGPRLASARAVGASQTEVTLALADGVDFTPASGILGFQVTENGQAVPITAAVRTSRTTILLSHGAIGTGARGVSYGLATDPDDLNGVHDGSADWLPMEPSLGIVAVTG